MTPKKTVIFKSICNEFYFNLKFFALDTFPLPVFIGLCPNTFILLVVRRKDHRVIKTYEKYKFKSREDYEEKIVPVLKELNLLEK